MNKTLLTLVLSLSCMITTAKDVVLTSPGGQVVVTLNDEGGKLSYNVRYQGAQILEDSPLGIVTDRLDLTKGLTIENATDPQTVERAYELRTIKQRHVSVAYRQTMLTVAGDGGKMEMEWMVSDRDVAYRYRLLPVRRRDETLVAVVRSEASGFTLPQGTTTFLCPQSLPMTGFARTAPSYEANYTLDDQMGKNGWGQGYSFPCLFKNPLPTSPRGGHNLSPSGESEGARMSSLWESLNRDTLIVTPDSLLPPKSSPALQVEGTVSADSIVWDYQVGVAKVYALRFRYYNPEAPRRLNVKITDQNGVVYTDDDITFLQTQQKKSKRKMTSITTGTMTNAGRYHVVLTGEGLKDMIFDKLTIE